MEMYQIPYYLCHCKGRVARIAAMETNGGWGGLIIRGGDYNKATMTGRAEGKVKGGVVSSAQYIYIYIQKARQTLHRRPFWDRSDPTDFQMPLPLGTHVF